MGLPQQTRRRWWSNTDAFVISCVRERGGAFEKRERAKCSISFHPPPPFMLHNIFANILTVLNSDVWVPAPFPDVFIEGPHDVCRVAGFGTSDRDLTHLCEPWLSSLCAGRPKYVCCGGMLLIVRHWLLKSVNWVVEFRLWSKLFFFEELKSGYFRVVNLTKSA